MAADAPAGVVEELVAGHEEEIHAHEFDHRPVNRQARPIARHFLHSPRTIAGIHPPFLRLGIPAVDIGVLDCGRSTCTGTPATTQPAKCGRPKRSGHLLS
jgi:hypothetical protein